MCTERATKWLTLSRPLRDATFRLSQRQFKDGKQFLMGENGNQCQTGFENENQRNWCCSTLLCYAPDKKRWIGIFPQQRTRRRKKKVKNKQENLAKILTKILSMKFMQSSRRRNGKLRPLLLFEDLKLFRFCYAAMPWSGNVEQGPFPTNRRSKKVNEGRHKKGKRKSFHWAFIRWNTLCFDVIKVFRRPWHLRGRRAYGLWKPSAPNFSFAISFYV